MEGFHLVRIGPTTRRGAERVKTGGEGEKREKGRE